MSMLVEDSILLWCASNGRTRSASLNLSNGEAEPTDLLNSARIPVALTSEGSAVATRKRRESGHGGGSTRTRAKRRKAKTNIGSLLCTNAPVIWRMILRLLLLASKLNGTRGHNRNSPGISLARLARIPHCQSECHAHGHSTIGS